MKQDIGRVAGIPVARMMGYFVVLLIAAIAALSFVINKVSEQEMADRQYISRIGDQKVLAQEILARKLLVQYEDSRRILTDENDVLTVVSGAGKS